MEVETGAVPGMKKGVERVLGRLSGTDAGPTLICVGGLHGNETAGVMALGRVLDRLEAQGARIQGDFLALSGNRSALAEGRRYLDWDLNRSWTPDRLEASRRAGTTARFEDREQMELSQALDQAVDAARGPVFLLDLHTTSGPSVPFTAIMDSPSNRAFSTRIPVPLVLGFGELVDGTFFGYLTRRGITSVVFEGGQHQDPSSVDTSESALWIALDHVGLIQGTRFPEVAQARASLGRLTRDLPPLMEIKHRHGVKPGDGFRMNPGFQNFETVAPGQLLARDHLGEVKAQTGGLLLLPLYQSQGDDGFFIIREVDSGR